MWGVIGTLAGTILGAFLTYFFQYINDKKQTSNRRCLMIKDLLAEVKENITLCKLYNEVFNKSKQIISLYPDKWNTYKGELLFLDDIFSSLRDVYAIVHCANNIAENYRMSEIFGGKQAEAEKTFKNTIETLRKKLPDLEQNLTEYLQSEFKEKK